MNDFVLEKPVIAILGFTILATILIGGFVLGQAMAEKQDKVTICHIPPGNPDNNKTKTVGAPAVEAHLAHGDTLGPCSGDSNNGDNSTKNFNDDVIVISSNKTDSILGNGTDSDLQDHKETICHVPPGNPNNNHTISVGGRAVDAHLAHGDFLGTCGDITEPIVTQSKEKQLEKQTKASQRSDDLIQKLEERIADLEQRLQKLLEKIESGEYFGETLGGDSYTNTYSISFDGNASSVSDESVTTDISGEIYLENLVSRSKVSKYKVTGGEVIAGDVVYDLVFGKARTSPGSSGDTTMVLITQALDSDGNYKTIRLTLNLEDQNDIQSEAGTTSIEIIPNSKISGLWNVNANGDFSLIET